MMLLSLKKKEWNIAICSNLDGPRDGHTKWSVRQRKTNIIWYCLYVESKQKKDTSELHDIYTFLWGFFDLEIFLVVLELSSLYSHF